MYTKDEINFRPARNCYTCSNQEIINGHTMRCALCPDIMAAIDMLDGELCTFEFENVCKYHEFPEENA